VHPIFVFVFMMSAQSTRNVASQTLTSRIPAPHERAGFQSLQSAVQHLGSAVGSSLGSVFLSTAPSGELLGVPALAAFAIAVSLPLPLVTARLSEVLAARPEPAGRPVAA
jgi:predicted MFS family arabinose efflux permease